jgi:glycosyltransferase involved in cell wall biosynthesis
MKLQNPLVSVVVVTYNQEETISKTLDSILNQKTDFPFEIIIGEDASPYDNTRGICKNYAEEYPDIINLLPEASNKGIVRNYRDCLKACRGKYVASCAGDDWWHNPDKLSIQVGFLEQNEDYGVVYTDCSLYYPKSRTTVASNYNDTDANPLSGGKYEELILRCHIIAPTVMFRYNIYKQYINFDLFEQEGFLMEDYPMWLEMQQHTRFKYLPISTSTYSIADGSLCHHGKDLKKKEKFESSMLLVRKYFLRKYPVEGLTEKCFEEIFNRNMFLAAFSHSAKEYIDKYRTGFKSVSWKDSIKKMIAKNAFLYNITYRILSHIKRSVK